ncbi:MAG: domain 2 [Verrucomicrobiota bacterium]|jgi:uncharacterized RDD family membrane protein YckC
MNYFVQVNGEEHGPYDDSTLQSMARQQEFGPEDLVRNSLMKTGKPAREIPILKEIFAAAAPKKQEAQKFAQNLHRSKDSIKPGPPAWRALAFLIDLACLAPFIFGIMTLTESLKGGPDYLATLLALSLLFSIFFFAINLGLFAQTPGMRFFGLMIIRGEGEAVLLGRSFTHAALGILLLPLLPIAVYAFHRGPHEILAGTRLVKVRLG